MDIKKYLKAMPVVAAMLLTASCSSEDNEIVEAPQPEQARIVPFTATVSNGSQTRAYLNGSNYHFQDGDKLYVWGDKISGVLDLTDNYGTMADFSGTLTIEAGGSLVDGTTILNAVVKSENDVILGTLDAFKTNSFAPSYPNNVLASDNSNAIEKFSFLTTSAPYDATYGTNFGYLTQQSSFLSFEITLEDGTAEDTNIDITVNNGGSALRTGSVKTYKDTEDGNKIKAKFVAGFPSGSITLDGATVKLGSGDPISFGGTQTLAANKIYSIKRTYNGYRITASATLPAMLATYLGKDQNQSVITYNKAIGYQTKLSEILSTMDMAGAMAIVTGCMQESGTSVSSDGIGDPITDYQFTVNSAGESKFNISTPYGNFPVTINVEKITVVTP